MDAITFWAAVSKVQTLADGGIRLTLDLPEQCVVQMAELAACKIYGRVIDVTVTEHGAEGDGDDEHHRKIHI